MMKDERMNYCIVWMNVKNNKNVKKSGIMPPNFKVKKQRTEWLKNNHM